MGGGDGGKGRVFHLVSLGCAKNLVEGEHLAGMLLARGWEPGQEPRDADWIVLNTCGFIRPAVEESVEAALELAQARKPGARLAVVGCLVGRYGKKLAQSLEEGDIFVSPGEAQRLPELLEAAAPPRLAMRPARGIMDSRTPRAVSTGPGWAYLRVGDGCSHRCAFCTIPGIRGPARSRTMADVLAEARELVESGVRELNLVAQDLTSFGSGRGESLLELLKKLDMVDGLAWIRMLYLHPDHLGPELIDGVAGLAKVLPYFDLPLQHISDAVLTAMGRKNSGQELRRLIRGIRRQIPGAVLRATLMTGHPGEGEAEFGELLDFVRWAELDHLGCFAYEPEAGTRSARMDAPPSETALSRREEVMAAQQEISRCRLAGLVGGEADCLILGPHPESEHLWHVRLARQAPEVDGVVIITDGSAPPGELGRVRITRSHDYDLEGVIL